LRVEGINMERSLEHFGKEIDEYRAHFGGRIFDWVNPMSFFVNVRWAVLTFFSGMAALIYQTLWVKQLSLVVGVEVYAVTTGVAAFFVGLALGSFWFGRISDRVAKPALLFAGLEGGMAMLGPITTLFLSHSAPLFVQLQGAVGFLAWILPFVLVGVPAVLMGGTLPALLRAMAPDDSRLGMASGSLYAANTAGAIGGVLAAIFLFIPAFGVIGAGLGAAVLNLLVVSIALFCSKDVKTTLQHLQPASKPLSSMARTAVILYGLAGGVALGYEVVWSQAIVQFLSTRTYAFAIMLATYLLGLSLGAALYARIADRIKDPRQSFGLLIAAAGICSLLLFTLLGNWLDHWQYGATELAYRVTDNRLVLMCARFAVTALVLILPPTLFLGAAFPAAVRLIARSRQVGADFGMVAAWNTAGGVGGTLITGFVLVPALGLIRTLSLLALAAVLIGAAAVLYRSAKVRSYTVAGGLLAVVILLAVFTPTDKLGRMLAEARGGRLMFYDESAEGTVAVLEQKSTSHTFRRLYIQGFSNSGDTLPSLRYMRLQGLLPLIIYNGTPRSALVIGLGTGITAGSILNYPLAHRECAELVPAAVKAASLFNGNLDSPADSRLAIHIGDGRHYLLATKQRFDLITLEPPPPSARGVVNLYSTDFYELARKRLALGGILAQWWPITTQNEEDSQSMMQSILDVFPYVTVWTTDIHEMMVLGSMQPMEMDAEKIKARFAFPGVKKALAEAGISNPAELLATYVMGRDGLENFAGAAEPVTDNRPRIEYAPWVRPHEIRRILPRLLELSGTIPLQNVSLRFRDAIQAEQQELFDFYRATLAAAAGDRELWKKLISRVITRDPDNPYYRWFLRGRA
jgi:spermidine synthase